ncbi:PRC-barrel domain containing protein [Bradyrhizobium sp. NP1]|uniref:PRC-barrel domain containing protein n=1 Tax=Bradyrhizobium sp. NP1 TaxID=3049772 RepID=UPI0025A53E37|nr:PRC-barrel domain containing protein [Bradyrhizobium sp. NP1]WJR75881.1 PRC-barrel domain containing protein [Bradyrhizobium sp. NP1]
MTYPPDLQNGSIENTQFVGTPIFGPCREPMGSIANILLEQGNGKILCVIATFECLDLGNDFYPVPWMAFKFNPKIGGYQTHLVRRQLIAAPKYATNSDWGRRIAEVAKLVNDYYGRCF